MAEVKDAAGEKDSTIEKLIPQVEIKEINLTDNFGNVRTYYQKKLSFLRKIELFAHLGDALDKATSGDDGLSLSTILSDPSSNNAFDADSFIKGIAKLSVYVPDVLEKFYCIVLDIPPEERAIALVAMRKPADEGGFSDDQGIGIIETFLDQNAEDLRDFFKGKLQRLKERWQQTFGQTGKVSSKRSKATPRTTQRQ